MAAARQHAYLFLMTAHAPSDVVLAALKAHGTTIRRVRYRQNRSVLVSVSRDGRTLNTHECFRDAPWPVIEAIVSFVRCARRSPQYRRALAVIRGWEGARRGLEQARRRRQPRSTPRGRAVELAYLQTLFDGYNAERFGGRLPDVPLRVSRRMTRSLGTIAYGAEGAEGGEGGEGGERAVREITISADLLLPENRAVLVDTLLHEMAHAEAWLCHGHRGHGAVWRRIAARIGCVPRAITEARVRRQRR
jgi:hypothetical protein